MTQIYSLKDEAYYFHLNIFDRIPSEDFYLKYADAHANLAGFDNAHPKQKMLIEKIIEKELDAVGIEPWLRTTPHRQLLTSKLLLISYLAECDGQHPEFYRGFDSRIHIIFNALIAALYGMYRLIRGRIQCYRYEFI